MMQACHVIESTRKALPVSLPNPPDIRHIHVKTNRTKEKTQNLLMAQTNVSEICLNGIRQLLQVDEINDALNILYFKAI